MFRADVVSTFSELWYKVEGQRPRLSPHARFTRQVRGSETAYIAEDPAASQYYRISEAAYYFVAMLDGRVSVGEAWDACNAQLGDDAPTQRECVEVLGRLQLFGLLIADLPLSTDMVHERLAQARANKLKRRTGMWLFYSLPLLNPEPSLRRLAWLCRALFSPWMLAVWLIVGGYALMLVIQRLNRLGADVDDIARLDPGAIAVLSLVFLALRAIHEFAHAASCKAMGGRSTEIGLLLIAGILPLPYCDASSAWRFDKTWKRVLVSSAGMLAEMFVASIAAIYWAYSEPGVARGVAANVMVVASVTTLLFNANPLLRYDGYYILSDITNTPNLSQRSRDVWRYIIERYVFGVRGIQPPRIRGRGEGTLLIVYGFLSIPYRLLITVGILMLISNQYLTLGVLLAIVLTLVWVLLPTMKGLTYLLASARLTGRRVRAAAVVLLVAAVSVILFGFVPFPSSGQASAVVEPAVRSPIRATESGFVERVLVETGDHVEEGQPLMVLTSPDLMHQRAVTSATLLRARAEADRAMTQSPAAASATAAQVEAVSASLDQVNERIESLTIRAGASGVVIIPSDLGPSADVVLGRFVERGTLFGMVASTDRLVVRSLLPESARATLFLSGTAPKRVSVRVRGDAGTSHPARVTRDTPAATRDLPAESLATLAGGDVVVDPSSADRVVALSTYFLVEVTADDGLSGVMPGQRARVRFEGQPESITAQLLRRLRRFVEDRLRA